MVNKVALVTGASRGIGLEIAKILFKEGYSLSLLSRNKDDIIKAWGRADDEILYLSCDVRKLGDVRNAVKTTIGKFGRIDVLVNNAGTLPKRVELLEETEEELDDVYKTNLKGPWYFTREVLPIMRRQKSGYIFNISSMSGKRAFKGRSTYSISKFGLQALTEATMRENKEFGIKATVVCPGFVNTAMARGEMKKENLKESDVIQPADIAKTIVYLLSLSQKAYISEICIERELW